MKAKKLLAIILTLAMMLALLAGCGGSAKESTPPAGTPAGTPADTTPSGGAETPAPDGNAVAVDKWVIPVLSAVTGPVSVVGEPSVWAAEYAAKKINDAGGIRGVPVEVVIYDTEFSPEMGAQLAAGLVDEALFMVGCMAAPVSQAISQIAYDAKVPNVGSYSYQAIRDQFAPYLVGYMSDSELGDLEICARWCEKFGYESIVMFYTPSDTSQTAAKELIEKELEALCGTKVAGFVEVETGTLDCGPAAVQALGYNADAYYVGTRTDEAGKVINELRTRGVDNGEQICFTFAALGQPLLDLCGENAEGAYGWNKLNPDYQGAGWQEMIPDYVERFGTYPTNPPTSGFYNAIIAFKQCVEELEITGDPAKREAEHEAIANWFFNSPDIEGIQGTFHWENGRYVSDIFLFQVVDGVYVPVD